MPPCTLVIGNKNYSSWSMRPWVLLRQLGIAFDEVKLRFHSPEWDADIAKWSPSGLVPVLWKGDIAVWDSLAIMEAVHEWFPDKGVWPADEAARAFARSGAAEMHSGFRSLRSLMPMNIHGRHPGKGFTPQSQADIDRIVQLWCGARERFGRGGDFLFGRFCAADAMFAPVVMRFATYDVPLPPVAARYCDCVKSAPGVAAWIADALAETDFVPEDEPYAEPPRP
jgi:glutathione S-transferase